MTQQNILLGTVDDDSTGDPLRVAGTKIEANTTELYAIFDRLGLTAGDTDWGTFTAALVPDNAPDLKTIIEAVADALELDQETFADIAERDASPTRPSMIAIVADASADVAVGTGGAIYVRDSADTAWLLSNVLGAVAGDDLGNHTATQDLDMASNAVILGGNANASAIRVSTNNENTEITAPRFIDMDGGDGYLLKINGTNVTTIDTQKVNISGRSLAFNNQDGNPGQILQSEGLGNDNTWVDKELTFRGVITADPAPALKKSTYLLDASGAAFSLDLTAVAAPSAGDRILLTKSDASGNVVTVTGAANGDRFIDGQGTEWTFTYDGASWLATPAPANVTLEVISRGGASNPGNGNPFQQQNEHYQSGGISYAAGVYTITKAATYDIDAVLKVISGAGVGNVSGNLFVNGVQVPNVAGALLTNDSANNFPGDGSISVTLSLNAGDTFEFRQTGTVGFGGTNKTTSVRIRESLSTVPAGTLEVSDQTASGYFDIGNMRMQWGAGIGANTLTFPAPFASTNYRITGNATSGTRIVRFPNKSTTGVAGVETMTETGNFTSASYDWIAIGEAP